MSDRPLLDHLLVISHHHSYDEREIFDVVRGKRLYLFHSAFSSFRPGCLPSLLFLFYYLLYYYNPVLGVYDRRAIPIYQGETEEEREKGRELIGIIITSSFIHSFSRTNGRPESAVCNPRK
jgi:hypothetical protein